MYGAPTILVVLADANAKCAVQDGSLVMEFESEEGKTLLKKWGIEGEWIGVGHCILGYPAGDPQPAAPRKSDYILKV